MTVKDTLPPDENLAHILQSMLDKVDGDAPRDWLELSESERGFYKMCIYRLVFETELLEAVKALISTAPSGLRYVEIPTKRG